MTVLARRQTRAREDWTYRLTMAGMAGMLKSVRYPSVFERSVSVLSGCVSRPRPSGDQGMVPTPKCYSNKLYSQCLPVTYRVE